MKIEYFGHSCFAITSQNGTRVITDPYTKVGYELPKGLWADIVTTSHAHFDHNHVDAVLCDAIVEKEGTYKFKDIKIVGEQCFHDEKQGALRGNNIIFKIIVDGVTICHLGDLGEECSQELLQKIGKVDILLLPVGGTYTIDAKQAKVYVDCVQPKVTIPMHFKPSDGALDIQIIDAFLEDYPQDSVQCIPSGIWEYCKETQTSPIVYMERVK